MFKHRPAMKICCSLIGGIIAGSLWPCSLGYLMICFSLLVIFILLMMFLRTTVSSAILSILLYITLVVFGMVKISFDNKTFSLNNVSHFIRPGVSTIIKGVITDLPVKKQRSIRFVIEADSILLHGRWYEITGGVLVSCKKEALSLDIPAALQYGRLLMLEGELVQAGSARNPGDFDLKHYLQLNDIYARLFVDHIDSSSVGAFTSGNLIGQYVDPVRQSIARHIDSLAHGEEGSFLKGLLIGERSEIPVEVKAAFINSGVMHIIAVSGLHVAIVVMILLVMLQAMRIPELPRNILIIVLLIYYNFLTGGAPSVTRSVIMGIVFLGAKLLNVKSDMYNTLGLSALILILIDAKQLFQPGFQLSFVAVFSLVYLYPKVYRVRNIFPEKMKENKILDAVTASLAVSVAAGIGTLPFTSIYFGKISIISFLANMIIVPLSNVILGLGMFAVGISYCLMWLASIYGSLTSSLTTLLLWLVAWFGNRSFSYLDSHFNLISTVTFYAGVGFCFHIDKQKVRTMSILCALITVNLILYFGLVVGDSEKKLEVTFIDVGQGDAVFIEFPDGKNMLIDAGPISRSYDAGARLVAPFLKQKGVTTINAILLSHPHSDHIGGVPYLLRTFQVGEIIDAGSDTASSLHRECLHLLDSLHIPHRICKAGDMINFCSSVRAYVLYPSGKFARPGARNNRNLNNQSLVVKILYGATSLLLPGDAEKEAEARTVEQYGSFLHSDLLKSGHHGSKTSSTENFMNSVLPRLAVISVGVKNKFHHPSRIVLDRYRQNGCKYYRTDEMGAVIMESDGKTWSYIDWR